MRFDDVLSEINQGTKLELQHHQSMIKILLNFWMKYVFVGCLESFTRVEKTRDEYFDPKMYL